jgi:hypothetical protein
LRDASLLSCGVLGVAAACLALALSAHAIPSPCTIDISIEGTEFEAPITSTQPAAVEMQGSYTGTAPSGARAILTLTGSVSTGWAIAISPATVQMSGNVGGTGNFVVTVVVPAGALHEDAGLVTVDATMTVSGLQCHDTVSGISVTPRAYLEGVVWSSVPPELNVTGSGAVVHLKLDLKANVPLTLTFEGNPSGGLAIYAPASFQASPPSNGPFNATVAVTISPAAVPPGRYIANMTIHAVAQGGLSSDTPVEIPVNVRPGGDPECDVRNCNEALYIGVGLSAVVLVAFTVWWRWRR